MDKKKDKTCQVVHQIMTGFYKNARKKWTLAKKIVCVNAKRFYFMKNGQKKVDSWPNLWACFGNLWAEALGVSSFCGQAFFCVWTRVSGGVIIEVTI